MADTTSVTISTDMAEEIRKRFVDGADFVTVSEWVRSVLRTALRGELE